MGPAPVISLLLSRQESVKATLFGWQDDGGLPMIGGQS